MDTRYNLEHASMSLLRYTKEREKDHHSGIQLLNMFKDDSDSSLEVAEFNGIGRLISKQFDQDGVESEAVEAVVSMQGIITSKDLPPFRGRMNTTKIQFYRQAVTIAVVDEDICERFIEQIGRVQNIFKRHYGDGLNDSCAFTTFVPGKISYNTFDISNRLFKKRADADGEQLRTLGQAIDPDGNVQRTADSNGFVHTTDNEVFYFERKKDPIKGQYRFVAAEPTIFQVGDIVEVQMSFVGLPLHHRKRKLSLMLRTVGLMDAKFSKDLSLSKFKSGAKTNAPARAMLKRAVGYADENVSIAESRLANMEVDDRASGSKATHANGGDDESDQDDVDRPEKKRR
ncbi:hypothetical protein CVT24_004171 [Panaeolus cyanescens]|uniref:Uncharacterized protein n=1 Tax=Panaeolus cyanescens TaxID=181874 RepID=A0A409YXA6_9AGAR|nr:hypothetical protein CVT24_004171 [Panaeolus cyanescens]